MTKGWRLIDLTGQQFGRLTVIGRSQKQTASGSACWVCQCECGKIIHVSRGSLVRKKFGQVSCGCKKNEGFAERTKKRNKVFGKGYVKRIEHPKPQKNNKLGICGVFESNGRFCANMYYNKQLVRKKFKTLQEAVDFRKFLEAENRKRLKADLILMGK